ncbi:MAG: Acetate kinase [Planctomycetes bacterium ADurb.Bin401]|nr:MAG: Acetate kinase [Planctomycetes bacterium ADurb.Bin401]
MEQRRDINEGKIMKILVLNCGSSSLKYRLIEMPGENELVSGEAQRVGPKTTEPSQIIHNNRGQTATYKVEMRNHQSAFNEIMKILTAGQDFQPDAIGHRVVHGGEIFRDHTIVSGDAIDRIEQINELAPIHNPISVSLIQECWRLYTKIPHIMVFDTAFHSTIPDYARKYAIPKQLSDELGFYKYGFHGTSHQFVSQEAATMMGIEHSDLNAVSCHLGSGGASLCAIVKGKSVDNTMGYSPLVGLLMSTRCGDIGASVLLKLLAHFNGDYEIVETLLNKNSGVLGVSGISADIRDILQSRDSKDENVILGLTANMYLWRIKKYLGAYIAAVGRPNAIIFTDTIGETVPQVRAAVCSEMEWFGIRIDSKLNEDEAELPKNIAAKNSEVQLLVIKTNEELAIARESYKMLTNAKREK